MTAHDVDLHIGLGEDYSAYLYWIDELGEPVVADEYATGTLVAADNDGNEIIKFTSAGDTKTQPVITVLGSSGYIRITAPRSVTNGLPTGNYRYTLAIDMAHPEVTVFTAKQRHFTLGGWMKLIAPVAPFA